MKWVLFVMLFTTAAYDQPKKGIDPDKDTKHLWILQSSTSMEFATEFGCKAAGSRIYTAVQPVATMTFRGYCLCESIDPKAPCPDSEKQQKSLSFVPSDADKKNVTTGIETIPRPK
jgi:hypothetical protein